MESDADTVCLLAEYGPDDFWDEGEAEEVYSLAEYPLTRRVLAERTVTQMTVSQPGLDPAELAFMQAANLKTLLMLPIVFQDRVVGLVEIMDQAERRFTDQEVSMIRLLAGQAGSAIENARLHAETQRQLKEQTALREAVTAVSSTLDLEAVLGHLAEQMGRAIDATSAYIGTYQPETLTFTVLAEYFGPRLRRGTRVRPGHHLQLDGGVPWVQGDVRDRPAGAHPSGRPRPA